MSPTQLILKTAWRNLSLRSSSKIRVDEQSRQCLILTSLPHKNTCHSFISDWLTVRLTIIIMMHQMEPTNKFSHCSWKRIYGVVGGPVLCAPLQGLPLSGCEVLIVCRATPQVKNNLSPSFIFEYAIKYSFFISTVYVVRVNHHKRFQPPSLVFKSFHNWIRSSKA